MGTRLRSVHANLPKGLLTIGGVTLVPRSIEQLRSSGIREIVLVTGWGAEAYERMVAERFPFVRCVHNPDFATMGSMHSLYLAREALPDDFLLLESDLLYEQRALLELLAAPRGDYVLVSGATGQGDEVFAYAEGRRLVALSKTRRDHAPSSGEFTGISRVTAEFMTKFCRHFEELGANAGNCAYDDAFAALAQGHTVWLLSIPDLVWCEIDDPQHHALALARVLPALAKSFHANLA
jgi:2-aminoethylphosphonate-pyruvate transaminase